MGSLLRESAERIVEASIRGKLYLVEDLTGPGGIERPSYYPAAVLSDSPDDVIYGEIYKLKDISILSLLDAYEECGPEFPEPHEYVRHLITVESPDKGNIQAWAYLYNRPVAGMKRITGGRWEGPDLT